MDPDNVGSGSEESKPGSGRKPVANEVKAAAVHEEMRRISRLPPNSRYASHRLRVLNKLKQLVSLQSTTSKDQEWEMLYAGLKN